MVGDARFNLTGRIRTLQERNYLTPDQSKALLEALNKKRLSRDAVHELVLGLESSAQEKKYRGALRNTQDNQQRIDEAIEFSRVNPWTSKAIVRGGGIAELKSKEAPGDRFNRIIRRDNNPLAWTYDELGSLDYHLFNSNQYQHLFIDGDDGKIALTTSSPQFNKDEGILYDVLNHNPAVNMLVKQFQKEKGIPFEVKIVVSKNPLDSKGNKISAALNTVIYDPATGLLKGYIQVDPKFVGDPATILNEMSENLIVMKDMVQTGSPTSELLYRQSAQAVSAAIDDLALDSINQVIPTQSQLEQLNDSLQGYKKSYQAYSDVLKGSKLAELPEFPSLQEATRAAQLMMEVKFPYAKIDPNQIRIVPKQKPNTSEYTLVFELVQPKQEPVIVRTTKQK